MVGDRHIVKVKVRILFKWYRCQKGGNMEGILSGKKVAVLVETEYIHHEIEYYKTFFGEQGAQVDLMTYLWGKESRKLICDITDTDNPQQEIHTMTVDKEIAQCKPEDYDIILIAANYVACRLREIPPMGSLGSIEQLQSPPAVQFMAAAMANHNIVKGALCHGLWLLTPLPHVLRNRNVICHTVVLADIYNARANYVPTEEHVVIDGDLVTGRSAADLEKYCSAILTAYSKIPDDAIVVEKQYEKSTRLKGRMRRLNRMLVENHTTKRKGDNTGIKQKKDIVNYDIDGLIDESTSPEVWREHLVNDLMKYWDRAEATTLQHDLFPTYRSNKGERISDNPAEFPPEIKAAYADKEETRGLVQAEEGENACERNYVRAHSRQTYAYGIAYNMTGNPYYLSLCKKGAFALINAIDGDQGMFTTQFHKTGKWDNEPHKRTSQDLAYGITGMGMYYYLTHDEAILPYILKVKDFIFNYYFDEGKGLFTWLPKASNDGQIEIVAQLDQIYGYLMWLTTAMPEPYQSEWKGDLRKIANILIYRLYSERYGFFWGSDNTLFTEQLGTDHTDFGHSIKTLWLIMRIGVLVEEMYYVDFAREKIDKILDEAYIRETKSWARRFNAEGELDPDKEWWGLAELDQACSLLALNDPSYLDYLNNTYDYWFKYMVDHEDGEIWHMVDGLTNRPVLKYPKIHSWKNSLHSFEHALFGYLTSSAIKGEDCEMFYAFKSREEVTYDRVRPYLFEANIVSVSEREELKCMEEGYKKIKVTFNTIR